MIETRLNDGPDCVLGSGPAAVACARALLKAGRQVVMIDPGKTLPADRELLATQYRKEPDPDSFVERMRALRADTPRNLDTKKLPFSSPYVYEDIERYLAADLRGANISRSLATGGLSAMWGATIMPFSERSFRSWPVSLEEMTPYYRSVAEIIDVPVVHDDLEAIFPNFGHAAPTALSVQGAQLMANLVNHRARLAENGISFGRGRSAVGKIHANNDNGCVYCGLCMYGCPYRAIFSAEYVVEQLKTRAGFKHHAGRMAVGFEETAAGVNVLLRHLETGAPEIFSCARLFVACGAATSVRLVAGAMKWFEETFYLMDTQLLTMPAFLKRRTKIGSVPRANVLGQVFVEIDDPEICDELIHLQIYGYNPFVADVLKARLGKLYPGHKLMQPLYDRMMMIMGYLPGQLSGKIALRIKPAQNALPAATYVGESNKRTRAAVQHVKEKLGRYRTHFGWWPATFLTEVALPGASHHLAGGLPMRDTPAPHESDRLGRPGKLRRVHVVDAAGFSDLPGEHLTYTIMANAARIAAQATERAKS